MTNSLQIWPVSPMPLMSRQIDWGTTGQRFGTGRQQSSTTFARPLMKWQIPFTNVTCVDRRAMYDFYNDPGIRGSTGRFLMMDPDDFEVSSSGVAFVTGVNTFYARTNQGYYVIPASGHINLFSVLSGEMTNGVDYTLDQDTGIITRVIAFNATDSWSVQSTDFFRKCKFDGNYTDASPRVWSIFNIQLSVEEVSL